MISEFESSLRLRAQRRTLFATHYNWRKSNLTKSFSSNASPHAKTGSLRLKSINIFQKKISFALFY
jgi:hypothetical protein